MSPERYRTFREAAIAAYAEDNVAAGRWLRDTALQQSRASFDDLLPQGLATPDNYLFEIRATPAGPTVGSIWFAVETRNCVRSAHVYDVEIDAASRRQGHALRAFEALEPMIRALGISSVGLHVFGHNPGAQALYARLGYNVTGVNMVKHLRMRT
jgi:ribosomal protein S18 acetylase RimI-like enzyme